MSVENIHTNDPSSGINETENITEISRLRTLDNIKPYFVTINNREKWFDIHIEDLEKKDYNFIDLVDSVIKGVNLYEKEKINHWRNKSESERKMVVVFAQIVVQHNISQDKDCVKIAETFQKKWKEITKKSEKTKIIWWKPLTWSFFFQS